jgi:myosin heavy subunit
MLGIYGFANFDPTRFEQLLINYSYEVIQRHLNKNNLFEVEQEIDSTEGVECPN